jgi:hypothetical protein
MQSSQLLSPEDLEVLKQLKQSNKESVTLGYIFGVTFIFLSLLLLILMSGISTTAVLIGIGCLIAGLLALRAAIKEQRRLRAYADNPPHANMKQVITEQLDRVELINNQYLRYHFSTFSLDVFIPTGMGSTPGAFRHTRVIETVQTLTNIPVALSVATLQPGINILLDIRYDQFSSTEMVAPLTEEDKKKAVGGEKFAIGCVMSIGVSVVLMMNVFAGFEKTMFLLTLGLVLGPMIIIAVGILIHSKRHIKTRENKIVIRTTLTEVMAVYVKNGKTTQRKVFYRLGNGQLIHIHGPEFKAGSDVEISYIQDRDGKRGTLIEMRGV